MVKHFINILDYDADTLRALLARAKELKARLKAGIYDRLLLCKTCGMYFEKPSLRTRVSLETAMHSMGGSAICLDTGGQPLGARETLEDQARVMSRYVDVLTLRTFSHETIETFAAHSAVPVINTLSDHSHPTQAMADILTMREHLGSLEDKTLVFIGDGNNVARSLAALCGRLGIRFVLCAPEGYTLNGTFVERLAKECPGAPFEQISDPAQALRDAAAVYTDVWASMGQEAETEKRREIFLPYQVNEALMAKAPQDAIVLHCLPAHRGEEITNEVIDSPASVVFDQAENRMHVNRALFAALVADEDKRKGVDVG